MAKLAALATSLLVISSLAYAEDSKTETEATANETADAKSEQKASDKQTAEDPDKVDWSKVDWRKRLNRMQYYILRQAGTEQAFKNKFWDFFKPGQYRCAGCGLPLFEADAKFDSDCGWPSFDKTIAKDAITEHVDYKIGYARTEIRCRRCQSHLGHVFNDGPTDTGLRYCLNSAAMKFVHEKKLAAAEVKPQSTKQVATTEESKAEPKDSTAQTESEPKAETK
jgi:peptide-methionine (R)-S-oxide reductase